MWLKLNSKPRTFRHPHKHQSLIFIFALLISPSYALNFLNLQHPILLLPASGNIKVIIQPRRKFIHYAVHLNRLGQSDISTFAPSYESLDHFAFPLETESARGLREQYNLGCVRFVCVRCVFQRQRPRYWGWTLIVNRHEHSLSFFLSHLNINLGAFFICRWTHCPNKLTKSRGLPDM